MKLKIVNDRAYYVDNQDVPVLTQSMYDNINPEVSNRNIERLMAHKVRATNKECVPAKKFSKAG